MRQIAEGEGETSVLEVDARIRRRLDRRGLAVATPVRVTVLWDVQEGQGGARMIEGESKEKNARREHLPLPRDRFRCRCSGTGGRTVAEKGVSKGKRKEK
jgi:hypothetical protein